MADWYVFSGATGTGAGTSWANATLRVALAATSAAAGDRIFLASNHSENAAATQTITFPGTPASLNLCISVNQGGSVPPVGADFLVGAIVATSGNTGLTINGSAYIDGINFFAGNGANSPTLSVAANSGDRVYFTNCSLGIGGTSSGGSLKLPGSVNNGSEVNLDNTTLVFNNVGQSVNTFTGSLKWKNTISALSGAIIPTTLFGLPSNHNQATVFLHGIDLSALGSGNSIFNVSQASKLDAIIANCNVNSVVQITTGAWNVGNTGTLAFINTDGSSTGFRNQWYSYYGTITTETTITMLSGASDGVQTISHKFSSNGNTNVYGPIQSQPIGVWVATGNHVATVELITSSSYNNNDVWVSVESLNSPSSPISTFATTFIANPLTAAVPLSTSGVTWNSSPATPTKYHLQTAFSTSMAGMVYATIYVGKASTVLYVNPLITLTS